MAISQAVYEGQIMMIADLQSQLAEAQRERDEAKRKWNRLSGDYNEHVGYLMSRAEKAEAELAAEKARADRLETAIRKAPHWSVCAIAGGYDYPCDCWKREALEEK